MVYKQLHTKFFLCFVFLLGFACVVHSQTPPTNLINHPSDTIHAGVGVPQKLINNPAKWVRQYGDKINTTPRIPIDSIIPANPKRLNGGQSVMGAPNNNCTSPALLTVNGPCTQYDNPLQGDAFDGNNPTACGGDWSAGNVTSFCGSDQWFVFQATQTSNYITINGTGGACVSGIAIYGPFASATPGCPTNANLLYCSNFGAASNTFNTLAYTVGSYYLIQVMDFNCGGCNPGGNWCISVLSPETGNNNCTAPQLLTVGNACTPYNNQATGNAFDGNQVGAAGCASDWTAANITSFCGKDQWFVFKATATNNYVNIKGAGGACISGIAIYGPFASATPGCPTAGNLLYCSNFGASANFNTLVYTVGSYYLIQVMDFSCGGCSPDGAWCITVLTPQTNNCGPSTCATPCGLAYSYNSGSVPASWYVESPRYQLVPNYVGGSGTSSTYCFYTQANNTSDQVNMGWVSSSGSDAGCSFSAFNWALYSATCGATIASGNIGSLNATGLTCGQEYIYCCTFVNNCSLDSISPYIYNATSSCLVIVLPIQLLNFGAALDTTNNNVVVHWVTDSEVNNNFFTVSRSTDGRNFSPIGKVKGRNTSTGLNNYLFVDTSATEYRQDVLYYQLSQTDINDKTTYFNIVEVNLNKDVSVKVYPNPSNGDFNLEYTIPQGSSMKVDLLDATGNIISTNNYVGSGSLSQQKVQPDVSGLYILNITVNGQVIHKKIVKL
jgi:hypothetical protein